MAWRTRLRCWLRAKIDLITWKSLSLLGQIHFLKVSYAVLVLVPLLAHLQYSSLKWYTLPLTLRLGYFAALLLSLAHMIYQGFCPPMIKRFESPNDLYREMLQIKALQTQHVPTDTGFQFTISHCRENFKKYNVSYWFMRLVCGVLYATGIVLLAWVVCSHALTVLGFKGESSTPM